ncbi:hypothetical protein [Ferrimonas sp. YFM]|uniref:hypothetical protein n=1 Tax=Ferrimonas sp. YFM TaxID=3028878 RepID=UPI00257270DD|nr:hypothetical protein [Ferrimonas sp. YFM]BDY04210.1 hypothetical protein F0521_12510 [Ferrimonas sp. YFM]
MIRTLSPLLAALLGTALIVGCADHAMDSPGSEALVYAEQHRFDLRPKGQDVSTMKAKVSELVAQFDADASRLALHHAPSWGPQAKQLRQALLTDGLNPARITLIEDSQLDTPISLRVSLWKTLVGECSAHRLDQPYARLGCAVDANRVTHTRHPDSLAKGGQ